MTIVETPIADPLGDERSPEFPVQYSITSYGADYPVDGLVRRLISGDILVPAFQRSYVWTLKQASRFIESLLLGLPVPGIFLSREQAHSHLLVIDGQQRLRTLQYFYEGVFADTGREFALRSVQQGLEGLTFKRLSDDARRRLDDYIIHATIIKQDVPAEDDSSIYHIFERLNTEGTSLQPQEIRTAIYHGPFINLLKRLNDGYHWRRVYGAPNKYMRDQELILRFFALYFDAQGYARPMTSFLNQYTGKNRNIDGNTANAREQLFETIMSSVDYALGKKAFRLGAVLNAAVFDSVMVGLARRLELGPIRDVPQLTMGYEALLSNETYVAVCSRSTADEERVRARLKMATDAFSAVK